MPVEYAYKAADSSGRVREGKITADTLEQVENTLRQSSMMPLEIEEANTGMKREISFGGGKRVKLKDLAVFSRQFAVMINAGLSLLRALSVLTEQTESVALQKVLREVRTDVENGATLAQAMVKHERVFPPIMISMVKAGETGGFLDHTMTQLADSFESEVKLRSKIKAAMTYPVAVLVIAIIISIAMLIFVVPTFAGMFEGLGGELPLPTKVLVAMSNSMTVLMPALLVFTGVGFYTWRNIKHKEEVRDFVDPLKLRMPVFGNLLQKLAIARFSRNLATLLSAGVPILQSLDIVADAAGNQVVAHAVQDIKESVQQGEFIHKPMARHDVFPGMVVQMVAVGEDTGSLDEMLVKIADFYDAEVEAITESLTALIEPLMIALIGGIVGAMVISLYLPMFKIFDLIK